MVLWILLTVQPFNFCKVYIPLYSLDNVVSNYGVPIHKMIRSRWKVTLKCFAWLFLTARKLGIQCSQTYQKRDTKRLLYLNNYERSSAADQLNWHLEWGKWVKCCIVYSIVHSVWDKINCVQGSTLAVFRYPEHPNRTKILLNGTFTVE